MLIKDLAECSGFKAMDGTCLCELLHQGRDAPDLPYSIAHARLEPGTKSLPHRLKISSEVYFILKGTGRMYIDSEDAEVHPGQVIFIPPGSWQHICNIGSTELSFLCIVHPIWKAEDEEVLLNGD